jgi:phage tail-like protein
MLPDLSNTNPTAIVGRRTVFAVIGIDHSRFVSAFRTVTSPVAESPSEVPLYEIQMYALPFLSSLSDSSDIVDPVQIKNMAARKDPWRNFRFLLEWEGLVHAGFSEVTIPDTSADPIDLEGNEITNVRKTPGSVKYSNVVCRRGITDNMELFEWYKEIVEGKISTSRKTVSILLLDEERNETSRWDLAEAWPTKCDPPDLNATESEIAIEIRELAHEGMQQTK